MLDLTFRRRMLPTNTALSLVLRVATGLLLAQICQAEEFNLTSRLKVDIADKEFTIQPMPEAGLSEPTLCLREKGEFLTLAVSVQEPFPGTLDDYKTAFVAAMPSQGATMISMEHRSQFPAPSGLEMKSYKARTKVDGEMNTQLIFFTRLAGEVHLTIFSFPVEKECDSTAPRVDAIMKTAKLR